MTTIKKLRSVIRAHVSKVMTEAAWVGDCTKCYRPIMQGDAVEDFGMLFHKKCRQVKRKVTTRRPVMGKAGPTTKTAPTTFHEFRTVLGVAFQKCNAPEDLVQEINDLDYEGSGVPAALHKSWSNIEYEMSDITHDNRIPEANKPQEKWEVFTYYVHDCVIDVLSEYSDAYNYEPGRKTSRFAMPGFQASFAARVEKAVKA